MWCPQWGASLSIRFLVYVLVLQGGYHAWQWIFILEVGER